MMTKTLVRLQYMGQPCNTFLNNTQRGPDGVWGRAQLVHMTPGDMEECWSSNWTVNNVQATELSKEHHSRQVINIGERIRKWKWWGKELYQKFWLYFQSCCRKQEFEHKKVKSTLGWQWNNHHARWRRAKPPPGRHNLRRYRGIQQILEIYR